MRAPSVLSPRHDKIVQYFDVSTLDFKRNPNKDALKQRNNSVYKDALQKLTKLEEIPSKYEDVNSFVDSCNSLYDLHKEKSKQQNITLKPFGTMSKTQEKSARKCLENMIATVLMNYDKKISYKEQQYLSFMTLTLPIKQRHTDKVFRKLLVRMIENLTKTYKVKYYVWRAEPQSNGNIHFHVLLDRFIDKDKINVLWCKQLEKLGYISFYQNRKDTTKLPPATQIISLKKVKNTVNYLLKYMTKPEKGKRPIIGQLWGASNLTKKLEYPKFYDTDKAYRSLELIIKNKEVKPVLVDEFFSVYSGNIEKIIKKRCYNVWRMIKEHYKRISKFTLELFKEWEENPVISHESSVLLETDSATKFLDELNSRLRENKFIASNKKALQRFKKNYLNSYCPVNAKQFSLNL